MASLQASGSTPPSSPLLTVVSPTASKSRWFKALDSLNENDKLQLHLDSEPKDYLQILRRPRYRKQEKAALPREGLEVQEARWKGCHHSRSIRKDYCMDSEVQRNWRYNSQLRSRPCRFALGSYSISPLDCHRGCTDIRRDGGRYCTRYYANYTLRDL